MQMSHVGADVATYLAAVATDALAANITDVLEAAKAANGLREAEGRTQEARSMKKVDALAPAGTQGEA